MGLRCTRNSVGKNNSKYRRRQELNKLDEDGAKQITVVGMCKIKFTRATHSVVDNQ